MDEAKCMVFASFPLTVKCLLNPPRVQSKAQRREMVIPFQEVATQQCILKNHAIRLYEGMVIGIHSRDNDLVVNPIKGKQLTNIRASGTDEAVTLTPPIQLTLESAIEFIADDELVEITPKTIRIRKRYLLEHERKRASRVAA